MDADQKLTMITDALESGKNVFIRSSTRVVKVTPKVWAAFNDVGKPFFTLGNNGQSLLMIERWRYVCADYVSIYVDN